MTAPRPVLALLAVLAIGGPLVALRATQPPAPTPDPPAALSLIPAAIAVPKGAVEEEAGAEGTPAKPPVYEDLSATSVVTQGDGKLVRVLGQTARAGTGPLKQYTVSVEGGIGISGPSFAAQVDAILADPRSWGAGGRMSFQRVESGDVDFRVVLASPRTTDKLCYPLTTESSLSCGIGGMAVINALRWQRGASAYEGQLPRYRQYVINHEVGHELGHGHEQCAGAGRLAPVMMQQTIGIGACLASPWPHPSGR